MKNIKFLDYFAKLALSMLMSFSLVFPLTTTLSFPFKPYEIAGMSLIVLLLLSVMFINTEIFKISIVSIASAIIIIFFYLFINDIFHYIYNPVIWLIDYIKDIESYNQNYSLFITILFCIGLSSFVYIFTFRKFNFPLIALSGIILFPSQWIFNFFSYRAYISFYTFCICILVYYFLHIYYKKSKQNAGDIINLPSFLTFTFPICIIIIILTNLMPVSSDPVQWEWMDSKIQNLYNKITLQFNGSSKFYSTQNIGLFSLKSIGFGDSESLGGDIKLDNTKILEVESNERIYLRGRSSNLYLNNTWDLSYNTENFDNNPRLNELPIDTLDHKVNYDIFEIAFGLPLLINMTSSDISNFTEQLYDFLEPEEVNIHYFNIITNSVFAPLKSMNFEFEENIKKEEISVNPERMIVYTEPFKNNYSYSFDNYNLDTDNEYIKELLRYSSYGLYEDAYQKNLEAICDYILDSTYQEILKDFGEVDDSDESIDDEDILDEDILDVFSSSQQPINPDLSSLPSSSSSYFQSQSSIDSIFSSDSGLDPRLFKSNMGFKSHFYTDSSLDIPLYLHPPKSYYYDSSNSFFSFQPYDIYRSSQGNQFRYSIELLGLSQHEDSDYNTHDELESLLLPLFSDIYTMDEPSSVQFKQAFTETVLQFLVEEFSDYENDTFEYNSKLFHSYITSTYNSIEFDNLISNLVDLNLLKDYSNFVFDNYTFVPDTVPDRVHQLAQEITKDEKNNFDKAKKIETYLAKNYFYTLLPGNIPEERDFVDYFLFDINEGYCTYFATSMAILARCVGIPTRYVEGYRLPLEKSENDLYEVRNNHAHAWVEAYFEGIGWVAFEPTATYNHTYYNPDSTPPPHLNDQRDPSGIPYDYNFEQSDSINQYSDYTEEESNIIDLRLILIILFAIIIIPLIITFNMLRRKIKLRKIYNLNARECILKLFENYLKLLSLQRIPVIDGETPLEYAKRLDAYGYFRPHNFSEITNLFVKARYSQMEITSEEKEQVYKFYRYLLKITRKKIKLKYFFITF
ncbi:transglutaminase domain-containing protein [Herbivorax sp. ANBcel31]|uniref:DUF4129 domain-containing transglutaminase family protein n=1 Tax=Herbivorax sp. ANBcel31 TaxID=3069754 RepID=UPI0027AF8531|nr:transglutaminase domain-containing protein [Herbivorax sp. ANBcel31]MDQ2085994.1 transglutaminase domain-containing protein [Herbivorax sp. ANBcel31]